MFNAHTTQVGDKVAGLYCGAEFEGEVESRRSHTMNWKRTEFSIILSQPIIVPWRTIEDDIIMTVTEKGHENNNTYFTC